MRLKGGVGFSILSDGDAEGCERDRRGGAKESCECFGPQHFSEYGKEADDGSADEEAGERVPRSQQSWIPDLSGGALRFLDHAHCDVAFLQPEQLVLFAFEVVVVDEEVLELVEKLVGQICKRLDICVLVVLSATASRRSLRIFFLPSSCSPSMMPMSRARTAMPGKAGSSISSSTSMGSPSAARVRGRKPKS